MQDSGLSIPEFCRLLEGPSNPPCLPTSSEEPPAKKEIKQISNAAHLVNLPPTAPDSDPPSSTKRLFMKHALFTQTPLLPPGRLREGQAKGGLRQRGGNGGFAPFSLAAINGNKSSTLCAQLFHSINFLPSTPPARGSPSLLPARPPGPRDQSWWVS